MDAVSIIGLISAGVIILAIIAPKPSQRSRRERIDYLLNRGRDE